MRGQRFSTPEEALDAFRRHVSGDTLIRVAKVFPQLENILKNNKTIFDD